MVKEIISTVTGVDKTAIEEQIAIKTKEKKEIEEQIEALKWYTNTNL